MQTLSLSPTGLFDRFLLFSWRRGEGPRHVSGNDVAADDARARRDFVQEMIARDPHAFSSDLDVQSVLLFFSDRF